MWRSGDATTPTALPAPPSGEETTAPRQESSSTRRRAGTGASGDLRSSEAGDRRLPEPVVTKPSDARSGSAVSLVEAKLCRSLSTSTWQCTEAANPAAPGPFIFYTRVKSARDTTVQHRWYLNGDLRGPSTFAWARIPGRATGPTVATPSAPNVAAPGRSSCTMQDGALLHEERFVVQ